MRRVRKPLVDFTSLNYWVVRDYYRLVEAVNAIEPQIKSLSDEQVCVSHWFSDDFSIFI